MNIRQKMLTTSMLFILSASVMAATTANSNQQAITKLQQQIQADSAQWHQALQKQQATTQKALTTMQTQIQTQITNIQNQIKQLQAQLTNEMKQLQAQTAKTISAPAAPKKKASPTTNVAPVKI